MAMAAGNLAGWDSDSGFFAVAVQRGVFGVETWELSIGQSVTRANGCGVTSPHLTRLYLWMLRGSAQTPFRNACSQLPTPSHAPRPRNKPTRHF